MGLRCNGDIPQFLIVGVLLCFLVIKMSQRSELSSVLLFLCNPNTGRNAKSSLPAIVSHPNFFPVLEAVVE